jgi:hypothetical protein
MNEEGYAEMRRGNERRIMQRYTENLRKILRRDTQRNE